MPLTPLLALATFLAFVVGGCSSEAIASATKRSARNDELIKSDVEKRAEAEIAITQHLLESMQHNGRMITKPRRLPAPVAGTLIHADQHAGRSELASGDRPLQWCGWWMRQHLGAQYGPEFNVALNWLNAGRPIDGPGPGAIGVKPHHVFQVLRVIDRRHVLAISGNDHNAVLTRIRAISDVIGWRDISQEGAEKTAVASNKSDQTTNKHFAIEDTVGNCSVLDSPPSDSSGMRILGDKNGYSSVRDAQAAVSSADCKGKIDRG
jgi:hypothetical protein